MKIIVQVLIVVLTSLSCFGAPFQMHDENGTVIISTKNYQVKIIKKGFRYGFSQPDGNVIAGPQGSSGLEFAGGAVVDSQVISKGKNKIIFQIANDKGERANVEIVPFDYYIQFSITADSTGNIVARTAGISPAFGLGDLGMKGRQTTELTGYINDDFHADGGQCGRLISNFVIFPRQGFAEVNIEPGSKIVHLTEGENAQGSKSVKTMPALYYFFGPPGLIYTNFLSIRNKNGYRVYCPKYDFFGVGWEAWGALAGDTSEETVTENVQHYLTLGYPLSWMVVGSGFWPRQYPNFCATTSFGFWDTNLYPHPREFINTFHKSGLKFIIGLRISFITNGPYAAEGVMGGCFLTENGAPKIFKIDFPNNPCYLLDAQNPKAVQWYVGLCQKWLDYGVDGFKEDLFGYSKYNLRDDKVNSVNAALMDRGVLVMGRNGYLGSPMDLHRFDDFNFNQNQDRGPLNGLAFAYSGFPYVYPDIVGGSFLDAGDLPPLTDSKLRAYIMRSAQYCSVNPSMSMGYGPWNFNDEQVEQVVLHAAQLHAQLQPYIYSAAVDACQSGFPWTLAPLVLVWPQDPEVYKLENSNRRGYEWLLGPSLLACPLCGDDYATAQTRDVYLPAGKWMDYDTGELYTGPKLLNGFPLPPSKTPLFIGGKGVLVKRNLKDNSLSAFVYPIIAGGSAYNFTCADGKTRIVITNDNKGWNTGTIVVKDTTNGKDVSFEKETSTGAVCFKVTNAHDYRLTGGQ